MEKLALSLNAKYLGIQPYQSQVYYVFCDNITGSTFYATDADHAKARIVEVRKAFSDADFLEAYKKRRPELAKDRLKARDERIKKELLCKEN